LVVGLALLAALRSRRAELLGRSGGPDPPRARRHHCPAPGSPRSPAPRSKSCAQRFFA